MMRLDAFWSSQSWLNYEAVYTDQFGPRAALLASAAWQTRVIDLKPQDLPSVVSGRLGYDPLWAHVRKSYHSLISKASREFNIVRVGTSNADFDIPRAHAMHVLAAGRETRPPETWHQMTEWVRQDEAMLMMCFDRHTYAARGYALFIVHAPWAYYASDVTDVKDINHALVWCAITALRCRGVRWLEMGWQGQATDDKGRSIEFFRRGFGGVDMALTAELPDGKDAVLHV